MTKDINPLFPPEWGWENYEEAIREQAAQFARRQDHSYPVVGLREHYDYVDRMDAWRHLETDAGRLPTWEKIESKGEAYHEIWRRLEKESQRAYDTGTLAGGDAHESIDLSEWRAKVWLADEKRYMSIEQHRRLYVTPDLTKGHTIKF